jgi:hypothetical protein
MPKQPAKPKSIAPLAEDLTPLPEHEATIVETWLSASRAAKGAAKIRDTLGDAMLLIMRHHKTVKVPGAILSLDKSVSYDYPAEIEALDSLSKKLKETAKKEGEAKREEEDTVKVQDFQPILDEPPATAQPDRLAKIKSWLGNFVDQAKKGFAS